MLQLKSGLALILLAATALSPAFAQSTIPLPSTVLAVAPASDPALPRPAIAPAPAWALPAEIPSAPPQAGEAAVVLLLSDQQANLTVERQSRYYATALKIGSAQALQAASLALAWDPALETLTMHRYRLIRDGKPIDLLKDGSPLIVMRREPNLEQAAIDGRLTATHQPDDVRVGDIVDMAFTITRSDSAAPGRAEHATALLPRMPIGRARIRIIAPDSMALQHRVFAGMPPAKVSRANGQQELLIDLRNHVAPEPPRGAPVRYLVVNGIEATNAASWGDIARTFAPQYAEAAKLAPNSPLKAEVARIRAASADPKIQAGLALALVQDQIRYLFLGLDGGGYRPAPADTTWKRRLGDCKAKSVLLLALLNELGINARPVLVSTDSGDALSIVLPRATAFNHVIIEAQIDGKSYWLDGTQAGETNLERLRPPPFSWVLPLADKVDALVKIPVPELTGPDLSQRLDLDARKGLLVPADADAEMRLRGPVASVWRLALRQLSPADRGKLLRDMWRKEHRFITPDNVSEREDKASGDHILSMKGKARMDWGNDGPKWYEADGATVGFRIDTRREPGPFVDAPFAFAHPEWLERSQTVLLPNGGKGFGTDGKDFDRSIGIHAFRRKTTLEGERFHFTASMRSLAPEMEAAKARAAEADYLALSKEDLHIRAPGNYVPSKADVEALKAQTPTTVEALLQRGMLFEAGGYDTLAAADGEAALKLEPGNADAKGKLAAWLMDKDGLRARKLAEESIATDPGQWNALYTRGQLAMREGRFAEADKDFLRALEAAPRFRPATNGHIAALLALGRRDEALAFAKSKADKGAEEDVTHNLEAAFNVTAMSDTEQLAHADKLLAQAPDNYSMLRQRAHLRNRTGNKAGAVADFEKAIATPGTPDEYRGALLLELAQLRTPTDRKAWTADLDRARKLAPEHAPQVELARAVMLERFGDNDAAVRALDEVARLAPGDPDIALMRVDRLKSMKRLTPEQAMDATEKVVRQHSENAVLWNNMCWEKAATNVRLETALADCDKALELSPGVAGFRDSRALTLYRLGRFKDALAEYDAILASSSSEASSLYGRGLTKLALEDKAGAASDFAEARKLASSIDKYFATYGLSAPDAKLEQPEKPKQPKWRSRQPIPGERLRPGEVR